MLTIEIQQFKILFANRHNMPCLLMYNNNNRATSPSIRSSCSEYLVESQKSSASAAGDSVAQGRKSSFMERLIARGRKLGGSSGG